MSSLTLSFKAPFPLLGQVRSRDPKGHKTPGAIAKRDVDRWYAAMAMSLRELELRPAEIMFIFTVLGNSPYVPEDNVRMLPSLLACDTTEGYGHVRSRLATEAQEWGLLVCWALQDAWERYAILKANSPEDLTFGMALHTLGLHLYDLDEEELGRVEKTLASQFPEPHSEA